jgi:hypothetical protein
LKGEIMQYLPGSRAFALIAGLLVAAASPALAQDTTDAGRATVDTMAPTGAIDTAGADTTADTSAVRDTTDTSGVQNPPGYRGMERDTTMFPDSGGPPASADEVEDQTTGTYDDSAGEHAGHSDTVKVGETEPQTAETAEPRMDTTAADSGM